MIHRSGRTFEENYKLLACSDCWQGLGDDQTVPIARRPQVT
jgi:hypothetical protein